MSGRCANVGAPRGLSFEGSEAEAERLTVHISVEGRSAVPSTGVYREPGELLIVGSIAGVGRLEEPVLLKVSGVALVSASGQEGERLSDLLEHSSEGRNVAEFGVGASRKSGKMSEAASHVPYSLTHPQIFIR